MDDVAAFQQELYEEHQEEASFLYELRTGLIHDEELSWLDLEDFDQRIQAHLDGLAGGGIHGRSVAIGAAHSGEAGSIYVAARNLCNAGDLGEFLDFLKELEMEEGEAYQALVDGLCLGCPEAWFPSLISFAEEESPALLTILMRVLAWRRVKEAMPFIMRHRHNPTMPDSLAWAQCRIPMPQLRYENTQFLLSEGPQEQKTDCALALLQLGDTQFLAQLSASHPWARIPLGLAGSRHHVRALLQATPITIHGLLALGLLGDPLAIPLLLEFLAEPLAAPSAAQALQLITGADLWEEVFLAEDVEEEDLLEEERQARRAGEPATNPNGQPAGEYLTRLCQSPETWHAWWQANAARFQEGLRYRNGHPFTPACLLENLRSEKSPNRFRALAHLEFQIRYGFSVPFELEMPIGQQKQALHAYATWVEEHQARFDPGQWYFAGLRQ